MRAALLTTLLVLFLGACGDPQPLTVTDDDAGATFEVTRDETFEIRLTSNPSTGFSWAFTASPSVSVSEPEFIAPDSDFVGSPGQELFEVTAVESGNAHLVFEYSRPWEDLAPEQTFEIDLVID
ncbi:MAG: protease inhibitor I42 family protein [Acidimicrobiia bacterium]|nr:protease inhibitor I42 family protein [Acidimicrobiia bacterium]MDH3471643.1 protease inhibitor I42 family protein [Acidimicrobiia bacterium]